MATIIEALRAFLGFRYLKTFYLELLIELILFLVVLVAAQINK